MWRILVAILITISVFLSPIQKRKIRIVVIIFHAANSVKPYLARYDKNTD